MVVDYREWFMDVEGFFQSWTLAAAVVTSSAAAGAILWKVAKAGDKLIERISQRFLDKLDTRQEPIIRKVVGEEMQSKLDNGSGMRQAIDRLQETSDVHRAATQVLQEAVDRTTEHTARIDVRLGNVERQLENVITEEIPQITLLAEHLLKRQVEGDAG